MWRRCHKALVKRKGFRSFLSSAERRPMRQLSVFFPSNKITYCTPSPVSPHQHHYLMSAQLLQLETQVVSDSVDTLHLRQWYSAHQTTSKLSRVIERSTVWTYSAVSWLRNPCTMLRGLWGEISWSLSNLFLELALGEEERGLLCGQILQTLIKI